LSIGIVGGRGVYRAGRGSRLRFYDDFAGSQYYIRPKTRCRLFATYLALARVEAIG
jgi:hypothetical protein